MTNIILLGECMIELKAQSDNLTSTPAAYPRISSQMLAQSFSGDTLNTAVYLKRTFNDINTFFMSAVGVDQLSCDMVDFFQQEQINTDYVFRSSDKNSGSYAIKTDVFGERSFTYWREDSAATTLMSFIDSPVIDSFTGIDTVFFSGISLAVIPPEDRPKFWRFITSLKNAGVTLVFDPNYRAGMWQSQGEAKVQFDQAFSHANILLPGVDDFEQLYSITTAEGVYDFCKTYQFNELVIKNGDGGILVYVNKQQYYFPLIPVSNVIDTTSAGDSFNGVYLGARAKGYAVIDAVKLASKAAGFVIQHHGAIVERAAYQQFIIEQKGQYE